MDAITHQVIAREWNLMEIAEEMDFVLGEHTEDQVQVYARSTIDDSAMQKAFERDRVDKLVEFRTREACLMLEMHIRAAGPYAAGDVTIRYEGWQKSFPYPVEADSQWEQFWWWLTRRKPRQVAYWHLTVIWAGYR
jgi:hypothetical protein